MRVFAKVVECGGFERAAEKLKIAATLVTRRINDLEDHLPTRLLDRTPRKLELAEAGQKYCEHVEQILVDVANADAAVIAASLAPGAVRNPSSHPGFGESQSGYILKQYSIVYPGVMLDVALSDRTPDLVDEGFDLGFFSRSSGLKGT
jgi:DNA-binding transcriptional LysR family regulator